MGNFYFLNLKKKICFIIISLLLFSIFHLFPLLSIGELVVTIPDILDYLVPQNFIGAKIFFGNIEKSQLFLNGELPWQFIGSLFYKYVLLFLKCSAYLIIDIIVRSLGFFCCFYFLKKERNGSLHLKILIAILFSSFLVTTSWGLGVATFPYLLSLSIREKSLKFKHYFFIALIALNTDVYRHGIYIYFLILFYILIFNKIYLIKRKNIFKIFFTYSIFLFLSNLNLIYSILFYSPFQLNEQIIRHDLKDILYEFFINIFKPNTVNAYFFSNYILIALLSISIFVSFFRKINKNKRIFFLIIVCNLFAVFSSVIQNYDINDFKSANFNRIVYFLPFFQCLIIYNFSEEFIHKYSKSIFFILGICIMINQLSPSAFTIIKEKLGYHNFPKKEKTLIKKNYNNFEIIKLIKNLKRISKDYDFKEEKLINGSYYASTINSYYKFEDYKLIKKLVKDNRTFSIGLDPYKALVSDIKVTGGYQTHYPLIYKKKFMKIIEDQINYVEKNSLNKNRLNFINRFKNRSQRLYSFVEEGDEIKINFKKLNEMNVKFIISRFVINKEFLKPICIKCNLNDKLYLYKIIL